MRWATRDTRPDHVPAIVRAVDRARRVDALPYENADLDAGLLSVRPPSSHASATRWSGASSFASRVTPFGSSSRAGCHPSVGPSPRECAEVELVDAGARRPDAVLADAQVGAAAPANLTDAIAATGLMISAADSGAFAFDWERCGRW